MIVIYAAEKMQKDNPKTYAAFLGAFEKATSTVNRDKHAAAEYYVRATKSKYPVEMVEKILNDPQVEFTMTPKSIGKYTDFMVRVGTLKTRPASWKDLFFANAHALPGS